MNMTHIYFKQAFAARLQSVLKEKGIETQDQVAWIQKEVRVTEVLARKWLSGLSVPMRNTFPRLANALGVKLLWLKHGAGNQ